ncbi:MAG: hypothetical protein ACHP8A_03505 [Terriglobales bacterium]|nr:hypothetical protein [Terriglobales bacterium]
MNPKYLWLADALQLLVFFVVGPVLAIAIAYSGWRGKSRRFTSERFGIVCVVSGIAAVLMLVCARRINADVRDAQYFLQLGCMLLSGLLFGVYMGCGGVLILRMWFWHKATRVVDNNRTGR